MSRSRHVGGYLLRNGQFAVSLIRSIQRATITIGSGATSNTATITAVNLNHARLVLLGTHSPAADVAESAACRIELTNETTVTALVNTAGSGNRIVSFEVIQYVFGVIKSVERGTTSGATATITAVQTGKAMVDNLGFTTTGSAPGTGEAFVSLVLTDATTITVAGAAVTKTVGYQVTAFY